MHKLVRARAQRVTAGLSLLLALAATTVTASSASATDTSSAAVCTAQPGVAVTLVGGVCHRCVVPASSTQRTYPVDVPAPAGAVAARELAPTEAAPNPYTSPIRTMTYYGLPDGRTVVNASLGMTIPEPGAPTDPSTPGDLIAARWTALGGSTSAFGAPTSQPYRTTGGWGRAYQNGRIYYSAATGAHGVLGGIRTRYLRIGSTASRLGFPVTDQKVADSGRGAYTFFASGDAMYTSNAGSFIVNQPVLRVWSRYGKDAGPLGFPTSDADGLRASVNSPGGHITTFQNGAIYWSQSTGRYEVHGLIYRKFIQLGGDGGRLGLPTSDVTPVTGGTRVTFQGGTITYPYSTHSVAVRYR